MRHILNPSFTLLLGACAQGSLPPVDAGDTGLGSATADSGSDGSSDGGGTTTDSENSQPEDSGSPGGPDFSTWLGARTFSYDTYGDVYDCEGDEIGETGSLIEGTLAASMSAACVSCDLFYELIPAKETACGWINITSPTWRGLVLGDTWAQIYSIQMDGGQVEAVELLDQEAAYDGHTISYAYQIDYGVTLDITGWVTFPGAP